MQSRGYLSLSSLAGPINRSNRGSHIFCWGEGMSVVVCSRFGCGGVWQVNVKGEPGQSIQKILCSHYFWGYEKMKSSKLCCVCVPVLLVLPRKGSASL